jgi:farnesyl diphosphate synthase
VLSGGKRLRGFLALESAAIFRVPQGQALRTAAAVECLHAYSLVHDDLPCMDDDDLRRGKPTVHVRWDEATAVLAGDALQTLAFEILAAPQGGIDPRLQTRLVLHLAQAAGAMGMVGGQALDIAAESTAAPLGVEEITDLQALKTGALFVWAAESGAILGRQDPEPLRRYGAALGLAFQIGDDVLDVKGNAEAAGKRLRKDEGRGKATFVSLLGLEGAEAKARDLVAVACDTLAPYGSAAGNLRLAARFALERGR